MCLYFLYPLKSKQVVLHEMFHNLGFWHEQNRIDRDNFVMVDWSNINPSFYSAFYKNQDNTNNLPNCNPSSGATTFDDCDSGFLGETYGLAYDYNSIMHYGPRL